MRGKGINALPLIFWINGYCLIEILKYYPKDTEKLLTVNLVYTLYWITSRNLSDLSARNILRWKSLAMGAEGKDHNDELLNIAVGFTFSLISAVCAFIRIKKHMLYNFV